MTYLNEKEIAARYSVTVEQMDKVTRLIDPSTGEVYFKVESQSIPDTTYTVRYDPETRKITCTCPAANPPRDAYGVPQGLIHPSCWHRRASQAVQFEHRQAENIQARKEAEEAAARSKAEQDRRQAAQLGETQGFSLLKPAAPVAMVGYDITWQCDGDTWMCHKKTVLAPKGQLPQEWEDIKRDPAVVCAKIASTSQRNKQAQKRLYLAEHTRQVVTQ